MNSGKRKAVAGTPVGANSTVYNFTKNTTNITTTNNYVAPAPAPTEAPAPRPDDDSWLPKRPSSRGRMRQRAGGKLLILCKQCKWMRVPAKFIPVKNPRKKTMEIQK